MLQIEQVLVRFGDRAVLDRVDLTLEAAETIAVLGPSGSGKTTLLRAVAGLQPLDGGRIGWDGADLATVAAHERRFGLMFQEYALFPHRDVAGNVEFGLRMTAAPRRTSARRVEEVLELVGLAGFGTRRVASLSGGEQQRVALARALAVSPRLLMLDEPLGALDRVWRRRLLGEIRTILERSSLAALYVTHDHEEAFSIASRVAIMRDGRIVQVGAPAEVWRAPADAWTATFLGFGPVVEGEVRDGLVHTPWGPVVAPAREPAGVVEVVVRPDGARLDPDGPVDATVVQSTFTGTHVELAVTSGSGTSGSGPTLTIVVPPSSAPVTGDRVRVSIDPDALLCIPVGQTDRMANRAQVEAAARELARRDPVLKRMLREHGVPDLHRHGPRRPHFAELARMICYQQLAGRAAAAIHGRFEALFDGPPSAEAVLAVPFDTLRGVGLSSAKAMSIRDLATKVEEGQVELDRVARLSDDKVVSELVLVRGIGEWTAHMFLMFQLGRLDIWPVLDFGVRSGFAHMYGLAEMPTPKPLVALGDPFRPYRSLVAWWCWRVADTVTPE